LPVAAYGLEEVDLDEKFPLGYEFKLIDKKEWSIREVCPKP
jgi:hypothetical protein